MYHIHMSIDETNVSTRHKKLLETIRENHVDERDDRFDGDGHAEVQDTKRRDKRTQRQDRGNSREARSNPERTNSEERVRGRSDSRNGQIDAESLNPTQSNGSN